MYSVTITADGAVEWLGRGHVRTRCAASKRVDEAAVEKLFAELVTFDFSAVPQQFQDPRCELWGADHAWAALSLTFADERRQEVTRPGGCHGNVAYEALQTLEDRIDDVAGVDDWIDSAYVDCAFHAIEQLDQDTFFPNTEKQEYVAVSELPAYIAKGLVIDESLRLRLLSHASVRDAPGASRARADAFVRSFEAAGGDATRIEVLDCGTALATLAADDENIWIDERLEFEFRREDCQFKRR